MSQHDPSSIRVFVACTSAERLPMRVLEHTIREHTGRPVEVSALHEFNRAIPIPASLHNRPRTPFSFQRFLIPELCGYVGRAIYLDADMQVFGDIAQLWDQPLDGCDVLTVRAGPTGRARQFSVMLLDCAALHWKIEDIVADLDAGRLNYDGLMVDMHVASRIGQDLPACWNSLECYDPGQTRLLHFTDMPTQPWVSRSNPLGRLWISALRRAVESGFISRQEVLYEVTAGHVRPSLLVQIDAGVDDTQSLTRKQTSADAAFRPPYLQLNTALGRTLARPRAVAKSLLRRLHLP